MIEYIHKAKTYDPKKHIITKDWFISEKLDGRYALWDGGISRGKYASEIPWANTKKDTKPVLCTGMWSSLGKVIQIPEWYTNQMPNFMVDGELWCGRGNFQKVVSITTRDIPDDRWHDVLFMIFGAPLSDYFLYPRVVSKTDLVIPVSVREMWKIPDIGKRVFLDTYAYLLDVFPKIDMPNVMLHMQRTGIDWRIYLEEIIQSGGEGIIAKAPWDVWMPQRMDTMLKVKPWKDDEGMVVGYIAGREGKTGKMVGKIGALLISWKGKTFELSGLTDEERSFSPYEEMIGGERCVGKSPYFPIGTKVTFKYRELTDDGIPKEARYYRKREDDV